MKSGMVAAEAAFDALEGEDEHPSMEAYAERLKTTWLWDELYRVRNIRGSFRAGPVPRPRLLRAGDLRLPRPAHPGPCPTTAQTTRASRRRPSRAGSSTRGRTARSPSTSSPRCSSRTRTTRRTSPRTSS
jgi:flavin-dependent dehydrogenase